MEHRGEIAARLFAGADPTQARLRGIDWSATALGPVSEWPAQLCTALQIILASPMPMEVDWGPELIRIFNDAARVNLGAEHLDVLGRPWAEAWPDRRDTDEPALRAVLEGHGARHVENYPLQVTRSGYQEQTYWTVSASPITGPDGNIGGVLATTLETTAEVLLTRRERLLRELGGISLSTARTPATACDALMRVLGQDRSVIPCAWIYLAGEGILPPQCLASTGMYASPARLQANFTDADGEDPAARVLASGQPRLVAGLQRTFASGTFQPNPLGPLLPEEAMVYPLSAVGQSAPDGALVLGINPYRRLDEAYRMFLDTAARRMSATIRDAGFLEAEQHRVRALTEQHRHAQEQAGHLQTALASSRAISYAIGILMALHKVTVNEAFTLLRTCSRDSNRKLYDVAGDVMHTGALPRAAASEHRPRPRP